MRKNKAEKTTKSTVAFHIFAVMLLATFLSCHVISGTMAKYVTQASTGDSARVASFSVAAAGNDATALSLKYGGSADYILNVNNNSEVAVSYEVTVAFDGDVSNKLSVALNGNTVNGVYDSTNQKTEYTFTNSAFKLSAGGSAAHTIRLTGQDGFLPDANNIVDSQSGHFDFETQVLFEQIN